MDLLLDQGSLLAADGELQKRVLRHPHLEWKAHYTANWPTLFSPSIISRHTIQKDPIFMNAASGDFRLRPCSPCVNMGKPTLGAGFSSMGIQQKMQIPARNVMYGANNRLYGG